MRRRLVRQSTLVKSHILKYRGCLYGILCHVFKAWLEAERTFCCSRAILFLFVFRVFFAFFNSCSGIYFGLLLFIYLIQCLCFFRLIGCICSCSRGGFLFCLFSSRYGI